MNITTKPLYMLLVLLISRLCFAEFITVNYSDWSDPIPTGQQEVSWHFDLSGYNLDAPEIVIKSATVEIWATSVDASIPADFWDGTKHYKHFLGSGLTNLSDPIHIESAISSTLTLAEGDGVTTIPLLDELSDGYAYLRDGALDISIFVYETDTWWDILDYSYCGNYFYLRRPWWDGSLELVNSRLTIEYEIEPAIVPIEIDIKPRNYPNTINLGSQGLIPVGILSNYDFDATTVNAETIELSGLTVAARGKAGKYMAHEEDVNTDGLMDLVVQVETSNFDPDSLQDGYALLVGKTFDGFLIAGLDEIRIVPSKGK